MIGKFFYTPKAKQFYIRPRFYDPEKEERDERERRIKEELGIVDENKRDLKNFRPRIKGQFRNQDYRQSRSSEPSRRAQNRRLLYLFIILALIFYLFYYSDILF
ncbi:MAG TPA: hypothetical protein VLQ91_01475 [Draconibacterium sp.]|nr:hypothetical protein [Draconibacterium sp.]